MSRRAIGDLLLASCLAALIPAAECAAGAPPSGVVEAPQLILPNYGRILIGSQGGMEAGALVVRSKATEAAWYNPAGLVRSKTSTFSANASLYPYIDADFQSLNTQASSTNLTTLPVFIGSSNWINEGETGRGNLAWGFTIVTPVAWQTDARSFDEFDYKGGLDRVTSATHTDYNTVGFGLVLSWAVTPPYQRPNRFALGASANVYQTTLGIQTTRYDDWRDDVADESYTSSRDLDMSLSAMHLGLTLGAYAGFGENIECGLVARLPAMKLSSSGGYDEHELIARDQTLGLAYEETTCHEDEIETDWDIPMELTAGIAWNGEKFDAELDLSYHAGTGNYEVFPAGIYDTRTSADSLSFTDGTALRDPISTTGNGIFNVAFGCRYEISEKYRIHGGFRTCKSHIEGKSDNEDIFQALDIYMLTVGFSSISKNTFSSFGLAYGWGNTDDFALEDLGNGARVGGELDLTTLSLFIGASFRL